MVTAEEYLRDEYGITTGDDAQPVRLILDMMESYAKETKPCTCPVCGGNGLVPNGFYNQTSGSWPSTSVNPETCRSCDGTGIVWNFNN